RDDTHAPRKLTSKMDGFVANAFTILVERGRACRANLLRMSKHCFYKFRWSCGCFVRPLQDDAAFRRPHARVIDDSWPSGLSGNARRGDGRASFSILRKSPS